MAIKKVTIKIIDLPGETEAIAHELRRYLLHSTAAFPGEWRQGEKDVQYAAT